MLNLLSPVFVLLAIAVRIESRGPVFFYTIRLGQFGKPIRVLKFRTMHLTPREGLTKVGNFLRQTRLNKLPQLWNVLMGEMSLVGPRPLLLDYLPLYTAEQARRHDVMPGITGWAQVNGRNALSHEQRFALDVWYVDNWSLLLDFKILAMTAVRMLSHQGISSAGHATMPKYTGEQHDRCAA